ncbi:MAG: hypothetical protein KKA07_17120 [Bacteroidetes bacterium]|nr:hypothetical protein [Bacteroidota bacterium]
MGLCIYYNGRFNPEASLSEMIAEIRDICEVQKWRYKVYETEFPSLNFGEEYNENIYGISFTPPECETVTIEFLSNGRMSNYPLLKLYGFSDNEDNRAFLYMVWVKTQFAGVEVHALLIQIFRHISKKYLLDFQMTDEGKYWETNDMEVLRGQFRLYGSLLDMVSLGLQTFPVNAGENMEDYLIRVMEEVHRRRNEG